MSGITPVQITTAAESHVDEASYGAVGTTTKCNFFARDVVEAILLQTRPDMRVNSTGGTARANDQFDNLNASSDWAKQDFSTSPSTKFLSAHNAANAGTLVVVAYKNPIAGESGHIAVIVPAGAMETSGSWGMMMPFIAHAGKKNPRNVPAEIDKSVFSSLKLSYGFTPGNASHMEIFYYRG